MPIRCSRPCAGNDRVRIDFQQEAYEARNLSAKLQDGKTGRTSIVMLYYPHGKDLAVTGPDRTAVREMDRHWPSQQAGVSLALVVPLRLRHRTRCCLHNPQQWRLHVVRLQYRNFGKTAVFEAWHDQHEAEYDMADHAGAMPTTYRQRISQLWRQRHSDLPGMGHVRRLLARYGTDVSRRARHRAHRQQRQLRAKQLQMDTSRRASEEPAPFVGVAS